MSSFAEGVGPTGLSASDSEGHGVASHAGSSVAHMNFPAGNTDSSNGKADFGNGDSLMNLSMSIGGGQNDRGLNGMMIKVGALGALGGLLFGYDLGLISGALIPLTNDLDLTKTGQELVVGLLKGE